MAQRKKQKAIKQQSPTNQPPSTAPTSQPHSEVRAIQEDETVSPKASRKADPGPNANESAESNDEKSIKDRLQGEDSYIQHVLKNHPGLLGPFFFAIANLIGLYYALKLSDKFNVNFIKFFRLQDFFFAWLQNRTIIFAAIGIIMATIAAFIGDYTGRRSTNDHRQSSDGENPAEPAEIIILFSACLIALFLIIWLFNLTLPAVVCASFIEKVLILIANSLFMFFFAALIRSIQVALYYSLSSFERKAIEKSIINKLIRFSRKSMKSRVSVVSIILYTFIGSLFSDQLETIAEQEWQQITEEGSEEFLINRKSGQPETWQLIMSTSAYNLFYNDTNGVIAIPVENVESLQRPTTSRPRKFCNEEDTASKRKQEGW